MIGRFLKKTTYVLEDGYDSCLQFCEEIMRGSNENNGFPLNILFSDEATFYLNGLVTRQTYRNISLESKGKQNQTSEKSRLGQFLF